MTPNQITTVRLLAGIGAAAALAVGDEGWRHIGAGIFVFSMVLDRADGELARLSGKTSPWGHTYDLYADSASNALAFIGLGIGLRASEYGVWAAALGLLAGLAVAAVLLLVVRMEEREGARAAELGGFMGFDPDDAMLLVPVAIWLGWSEGLLLAAAIGAPLFAIGFFIAFRRGLKRQGE